MKKASPLGRIATAAARANNDSDGDIVGHETDVAPPLHVGDAEKRKAQRKERLSAAAAAAAFTRGRARRCQQPPLGANAACC